MSHINAQIKCDFFPFHFCCCFVSVASLAVTITNGAATQEGSQHSFTFNTVITLQGNGAANAPGIMNRWGLAVAVANGTATCLASTSVTLTPAQSGVAIAAGGAGTIQNVVTGNLDLSGCLCSSVTELKVTLSSPPAIYTLSGVTEASATISCRGMSFLLIISLLFPLLLRINKKLLICKG